MKNSRRTFHKHLSYSFHTEPTLNYKHKPHKRFKDPHPKKVCKSIYKHIKHYIQENFQFLLSFSATKKGSNQEKIREGERERERDFWPMAEDYVDHESFGNTSFLLGSLRIMAMAAEWEWELNQETFLRFYFLFLK